MRICVAPDCWNDLDALGVKRGADCCSGACRAAKSRAKRTPEYKASVEFWRRLAAINGRVGERSPRRADAPAERANR